MHRQTGGRSVGGTDGRMDGLMIDRQTDAQSVRCPGKTAGIMIRSRVNLWCRDRDPGSFRVAGIVLVVAWEPMVTAPRFTVVNRFPSFAAAHSHQILRGKLFCGSELRKSFER